MTPEEVTLVQNSWNKVSPIADQAAALFYNRLFEIAPEVKPLFKGDMTVQGKKLMGMITIAVSNLNHLETVLPDIQASGVRHASYGVQPAHYDRVAEALLWTLEQGLKEDFTPEVKAAWITVYGALASTMLAAAEAAAQNASN
jgi:nitric oxide dioxygenase